MKAFTLIEIVIAMLVVSIIGIIAAPKLMDIAREARIKNEASALGGIRTGIDLVQLENRTRNISPAYPAHLDSATTAPASGSNPLFGNVLRTALTNSWEKTGEDRYKGPTGQEYEYDPQNGTFLAYAAAGGTGTALYYDYQEMDARYDYLRAGTGVSLFAPPRSAGGMNVHAAFRLSNGDFGIMPNDGTYNLYRYDSSGNLKYKSTAKFMQIQNLAEAKDGSLLAIGKDYRGIYKIDANGNASLFYGSDSIKAAAMMPNGNIAVFDNVAGTITEVSGEGGQEVSVLFSNVTDGRINYMSVAPDGTLYTSSSDSHDNLGPRRLYKGTPGGSLTSLATIDFWARGVVALPNGDIAVSDITSNQIKRYNSQTGAFINTIAKDIPNGPTGLNISTDGKLYTRYGDSNGNSGAYEISFPAK